MLTAIFWALVGNFVLIMGQFFIPGVGELFMGSLLFLLPFAIFSLLGGALIFLTLKKKVKGKQKKFLILTGASAAGFFVSVLLHNFLYALAIITSQIALLSQLMEILHVIFFIIGIIVCPIGFLVGVVASLPFFIRKISNQD